MNVKLKKLPIPKGWLAHRLEKSWATLLEVPGAEGTSGENKVKEDSVQNDNQSFKWYFAASSRAVFENIYKTEQEKEVKLSIFQSTKMEYVPVQSLTMHHFWRIVQENTQIGNFTDLGIFISKELELFSFKTIEIKITYPNQSIQ